MTAFDLLVSIYKSLLRVLKSLNYKTKRPAALFSITLNRFLYIDSQSIF